MVNKQLHYICFLKLLKYSQLTEIMVDFDFIYYCTNCRFIQRCGVKQMPYFMQYKTTVIFIPLAYNKQHKH